jgi:glycosyltransferase involved in cell wall biosynthesis
MNLIFIVNSIENKENSAAFQRAEILSTNFKAALVCKKQPPKNIENKFNEVYVYDYKYFGSFLCFLRLVLLRKKYKLVYTQYRINTLFLGFFAKKILGMSWIYDLWDHPSLGFHMSNPINRLLKFILWRVGFHMLKACDMVVISMSDGIKKHLPKFSSKVISVKRGYDINKYIGNKEHDFSSSNILDKTIFVIVSGWITKYRGVDNMIEILSRLEKMQIKVTINSAGWSDLYALKKIKLHNETHNNKLLFLGEVEKDELLNLYKKSQFGLCFLDKNVINYNYAYPIKVGEYMLNNVVVIATNTDGVKSFIKNGNNGYTIKNEVKDTVDIISNFNKKNHSKILKQAEKTILEFDKSIIEKKIVKEIYKTFSYIKSNV